MFNTPKPKASVVFSFGIPSNYFLKVQPLYLLKHAYLINLLRFLMFESCVHSYYQGQKVAVDKAK